MLPLPVLALPARSQLPALPLYRSRASDIVGILAESAARQHWGHRLLTPRMPGISNMLVSPYDVIDTRPALLTYRFVYDQAVLAVHFCLDRVMETLDL